MRTKAHMSSLHYSILPSRKVTLRAISDEGLLQIVLISSIVSHTSEPTNIRQPFDRSAEEFIISPGQSTWIFSFSQKLFLSKHQLFRLRVIVESYETDIRTLPLRTGVSLEGLGSCSTSGLLSVSRLPLLFLAMMIAFNKIK